MRTNPFRVLAVLLLALWIGPVGHAASPPPALTPSGEADAATLESMLATFGLSEEAASAFDHLIESLDGDVTAENLRQLIADLMMDGAGQPLPGEVSDGIYRDPNGFSFTVPQGWTLAANLVGPSVLLSGPATNDGVVPTITVTALPALEGNLATLGEADFERLLGSSLPNFVLVVLDTFTIDGYDARELVIMYGEDDQNMLIQYQAQFTVDAKTFLITMTSQAEEAAHGVALDVYDSFVSTFAVLSEQGNG